MVGSGFIGLRGGFIITFHVGTTQTVNCPIFQIYNTIMSTYGFTEIYVGGKSYLYIEDIKKNFQNIGWKWMYHIFSNLIRTQFLEIS
jgi:hypothetical protein